VLTIVWFTSINPTLRRNSSDVQILCISDLFLVTLEVKAVLNKKMV